MPDPFNPFPGLRPFDIDEDYLFFGREQQTAELLKLLRRNRFLSVIGTSGSGKSSLVRAGLLPELQGGTLNEAGSNWEVIVLRPGADPLNNLATAIQAADLYDPDDAEVLSHLTATLTHSGFGLVEAIKQSDVEPDSNVLIVVDQFEELFRFRQMDDESAALAASFVDLLLEATRQTEQPIYVVLTMRSDYLGDCTQFRGLTTAVNQGEYLIPRLTRDQIRTAIEGPVQVGGGEISYRLVQELLNSVGGNQDQLPILQHALMRTFDQWTSDRDNGEPIDLRHYQDVGGMEEALSRHADEVFDSLESDELKLVAEKIFMALTEQQSENRGIRRPTRLDSLGQIVGTGVDQIQRVVEAYRAPGVTFLMPPAETTLTPETIVDISHESLMRVWHRLDRWVGDESQSAQIYLRLAETATLHRDDQAGLYRGPDLHIALAWMNDAQPTAAWGERYLSGFHLALEFLNASEEAGRAEEIAAEEQRQRELEQARALADAEHQRAELQQKSVARMRMLSGGVAVVAVLAVIASVFAFRARTRALDARTLAAKNATAAVKNAAEARTAEVKATESAKEAAVQQGKAEQSRQSAEKSRDTLNETLTRSYFTTANEHLSSGNTEIGLAYLARSLRTDEMYWPAANQITSVLSNHNYLLERPTTIEMEEPIAYSGIDRHTKTFFWTATKGLKGVLWNARTGKNIGTLADGERIDQPFFTKDASLLFLSLRDKGGSIQGFSTTDAKAATALIPLQNRIGRFFFIAEPRPKVLRVVADQPGSNHFNIWEAKTGKLIGKELTLGTAPLVRYFVTGDEKHVAATFRNNAIGIWKIEDGSLVFRSKISSSSRLAVSANGRYVALPSGTNKALRWIDLTDQKIQLKSLETEFPVQNFYFHKDTTRAALIGKVDKTLHCAVVDLTTAKVTAHFTLDEFAGDSADADFARPTPGRNSSVGSWLGVFRKPDGTAIECRDLASGQSVSTFDFSANPVEQFLLPPDGIRIVTRHKNFDVRVWDIFNALPLIEPIPHVLSPKLFMSEDGERLFTSTMDTVKLHAWSSRTGKAIQEGHAFSFSFLGFVRTLSDRSQMLQMDRTAVVSGGASSQIYGKARIWDLTPRQLAYPKLEMPGRIDSVEFSPDSKLFVAQNVAGFLNSTAKLWNSETLEEVRAFKQPTSGSVSRFSPDGQFVAIGCFDGAVRVWNVKTGARHATMTLAAGVADLRYTADGETLVARTQSGSIQAFDAGTGYALHEAWNLQASDFDLDGTGTLIAVGARNGYEYVVNLQSADVAKLSPRNINSVTNVRFSPDSSVFVTLAFPGRIRAWDPRTRKLVFRSPDITTYNAVAFHPDSHLIAVSASPRYDIKWGKIELWDWKNGTQISEPLMALGQTPAGTISFSHNGRLLACGNTLGDISVWEIPSGAKLIERSLIADRSSGSIKHLDFSSDDRRLAVAGFAESANTGTITMIDLPPMGKASPLWLADLAETIAQRKIDDNGDSVAVERSELQTLVQTIADQAPDTPYARWGRWFFEHPRKRTVSPGSTKTTTDHVVELLRSKNRKQLHKVLELDPNNGLAHASIAFLSSISNRINQLEPHVVSHWKEMARWHSDQSVELDAGNADIQAMRALVMLRLGRFDEMQKAVRSALESDSENILANYAHAFLLDHNKKTDAAFQAFKSAFDKLPAARPPYDWQNKRPFLPGILAAVMRQSDRGPRSLDLAGAARISQASDSPEIRQLEVDWLTKLAVQLYPDDPNVWQTRSNTLLNAGRHAEAKQALAKSCDVDEHGNTNPLQLGALIRSSADRLIDQKNFLAAHEFLVTEGIPARSSKATPRQVDLSGHYNQSLFNSVYRTQDAKSPNGFLWKRLPVGLVSFNGIDFDVRGVIRLLGADTRAKQFATPLPKQVQNIPVNQQATWIHVLHNCSFVGRIRHNSLIGRYLLHYQDGTRASLLINYGKHVVTWRTNPFATPTHAVFGWREGDYGQHKSLVHCTWENPHPGKAIKSITFESNGSVGSPFLVAITLESPGDHPRGDSDTAAIVSAARHKMSMVNGATDATVGHVAALLKKTLDQVKDTSLQVDHVISSAAVLSARGQHSQAIKLLDGLSSNTSHQNPLLKARSRIHYRAGDLERASNALARSVHHESYRAGMPPGLDHQLTQRLFRHHATGKEKPEARGFVLRSQIPPRDATTPAAAIDLSKLYNAVLHEPWHRQINSAIVSPPIYRTLNTGLHHFAGIPFDIRGVINLSAGLPTTIVFPSLVRNIPIRKKADQLHFLNGGFRGSLTGVPSAVYRVFYADGKAAQFVVRWNVEIGDCWISDGARDIKNMVWRGEGTAIFDSKRDTALYLATWNNPRPDVEISHIDYQATLKEVNPFLVAITAENFSETLASKTVDPRELALRAVHKAIHANGSKALLAYAGKLSQRATTLSPENPELWRLKAEMFLTMGQIDDASNAITRSLELDKDSGDALYTKERVLVRQGQTTEALRIRTAARKMTLLERLPPRDKTIGTKFIDLTKYYNAALSENPYREANQAAYVDESFSMLKSGLNTYAGVQFDVRGLITLHGVQTQLREQLAELVNGVQGIAIGQSARTVHLLHGTAWGFRLPHGTIIGKYNFHFTDGSTQSLDIRYGHHLLDWFLPKKRTVPHAILAHTHRSPREADREIGFYRIVWKNPTPDVAISHIDFESYGTEASPFLMGITLDQNDEPKPEK
ncbi:MAG: hypothetical protein CMJ45_05065 [Planctomyces sp.]|nr:hypothetical protein [Planctomyces sp.]